MNSDSILGTTKKALGLDMDYLAFDIDVIMHINSVFSTLNQLSVGPDKSFAIEDESALWSEFIGDAENINSVKTYMYMAVRLVFDPPATSFAIESMSKQAKELEWRLSVEAEGRKHHAQS